MLVIVNEGEEFYDEAKEEFISTEPFTVELEHSLVSLSKWESKYQVPFLGPGERTGEEIHGYIEAMVITPGFDLKLLKNLSNENLKRINDYIGSSESATTFAQTGNAPKRAGRTEVITSELIYYWMVSFNIPFEAENWHLNRLFSLLQICSIKNSKEKKMSKSEMASRNRMLNEQRRAKLGTTG